MDALTIIRSEIAAAHVVMEQVLEGLSDEQLHQRINPETTNAIASVYAHCVLGEDRLIQQRIGGKPTLLEGWQDRLALPQEREALWSWHFPDFALFRQYAGGGIRGDRGWAGDADGGGPGPGGGGIPRADGYW